MMDFTGERYVSNIDIPEVSYEHWHRYLWAAQFVKNKTVLDIASGEGYGSNLLANNAHKVIGVDISNESVIFASSKYLRSNLEFRCGSAEDIPIKEDALFDVIISFETLEHLDEGGQASFIKEVHRLLRPDGILIISTPNKLFYSDEPNYKNEHHLKELYPQEFFSLLASHFNHVSALGQKVYPISYIWSLGETTSHYQEFQLEHAHNRFVPVFSDHRQALYIIAVCSTSQLILDNSILIDCDNQAIQQRIEHVEVRDKEIERLNNIIFERNASIDQLHDQLHQTISDMNDINNRISEYEIALQSSKQEQQNILIAHQKLEGLLEIRTNEVITLTQQATKDLQKITERDSAILEMNHRINNILNSPLFHITTTYRILVMKIRHRIIKNRL